MGNNEFTDSIESIIENTLPISKKDADIATGGLLRFYISGSKFLS